MHTEFSENILRLNFEGDLLSTNVESLRKKTLEALNDADQCQSVIVDLVQAKLVDSKGLNLLLAIYRETQNRSISFRVENPSADVLRMLTLLNLNERFGIKATA